MKDPNSPTEQPNDPVADALTDRNADPEAQAQDAPLKVHGDALLHGTTPSPSGTEKMHDTQRDEGF